MSRLGTVDDFPASRTPAHIWVSPQAPWYEILDDTAQFQEDHDVLKDLIQREEHLPGGSRSARTSGGKAQGDSLNPSGHIIRQRREEKGYSLSELARKLGITTESLCDLEDYVDEIDEVPMWLARKLSALLDIPQKQFFR